MGNQQNFSKNRISPNKNHSKSWLSLSKRGNSLTSSRTQKTKIAKNGSIPRISSFNSTNIITNNITSSNNSSSLRNSAKFTITAKDITLEKSSFAKSNTKISDKTEIIFIFSSFSTHPIFSQLDSDSIKSTIVKQINRVVIKPNSILYSSQSDPDYCYLLYKGKLLVKNDDDAVVREINVGSFFGEGDIIENIQREENVVCDPNQETIVFALGKDYLLDIIKNNRKKNRENFETFFTSYFPLLNSYELIKKNIINDCLIIYNFKENVQIKYSNNIYIIYSGEVNTIYNNEIAKVLRKGDIIGYRELILQKATSNISLATKEPSEILAIPYNILKKAIPNNLYIDYLNYFIFSLCFQRSESLKSLDSAVINKIYPLFTIQSYLPNDVIYQKGDCLNEEVIIVLEGNVYKNNEVHYEAVRNNILYEKDLIINSHSVLVIEDLLAFPECVLMKCTNEQIKKVLNGMTLREILSNSTKKKALQNMTIELLKHCNCYNVSKIKLSELEKHIKVEKYDNNVKIINQGSSDLSKLYIIKSGYVSFYINNKFIRTLATNSPFGFKAFLSGYSKRTATAIAKGQCEVFAISSKAFMNLVVNDNPQILNYFKTKIYLEDDTLTLNDLDNIRLLGKGSFGYVHLVKSKKNKFFYSIKAIPLMKIIESDMYELIQNEKNILKILDHNFLMKNVISLKNNEFVFLVNEYIKGKTLSKIIKDASYFSKSQSQFYIGSLLLVIEYLHSNNFIHRDIKPENIMVNNDGYIKLIDFGTVKETSSRKGTTHTIIGTPYYMAPEVIKGESYGTSVDYWSIGICLYEFYFGKVPFGSDLKDPNEIYKTVLNEEISFPSTMHDKEAMNLISGMLIKDEKKRLTRKDVRNHPWFEGFNWKGLEDMNVTVPFRPSGSDFDDISSKSSNYLNVLKVLVSTNSLNKPNGNKKEITVNDIEKGEKWLKDF